MRRVDRLVLIDIWGPWLFGVGLFAALLMAATYLGRIAGFIVDGVPAAIVLQLIGLLMPAILVKTFTMSVLLASLLGFGRLSSDSELVAVRAAGASVYRLMAPVAMFSVAIAIVTFAFNERVVPRASQEYKRVQDSLIKSVKIKGKNPIARTIVVNHKLKASLVAEDVNPATRKLENVIIASYDSKEQLAAILFADTLEYKSETDWLATGNVKIESPDLKTVVNIPDRIWPSQIAKIGQTFSQFTADRDDDWDSMTMSQLRESIRFHWQQGDKTPDDLRNMEYGYWTKIAVPLAAVAFGVLGAVLGIRNHRTGTATGFALAVAIIFGYVTLANFMNAWAMGGVIPPWMAAFAPLIVGAIASGVIMWRRNG